MTSSRQDWGIVLQRTQPTFKERWIDTYQIGNRQLVQEQKSPRHERGTQKTGGYYDEITYLPSLPITVSSCTSSPISAMTTMTVDLASARFPYLRRDKR